MTKGRGRIESFPALICPQGQLADHHGQLDTRAKPAAVDHSAFSASVVSSTAVSSTGASAASSTGALFNLLRRRSRQPRSSYES